MQFEFESECGLKVIHTPDGLRCVLSEVDARIHGRAAYYAPLPKQHDPTEAIHQAGWDEYDYYLYEWEEKGRQAQVQLADCLVSACTWPQYPRIRHLAGAAYTAVFARHSKCLKLDPTS